MQSALAGQIQIQKNESNLRLIEARKNAIRYHMFRIKWGLLHGELALKDAMAMLAVLEKQLSFY